MQTECPHCHTQFRLTEEELLVANGKVRCGLCSEIFQAKSLPVEPVSNFAADIEQSLKDSLFDGESPRLIPDEFRAPEEDSMLAGVAWAFGIIALVIALVVEYSWFHRSELITQASVKPFIEKLCKVAGCDDIVARAPEQIEMINRNVYTHPNVSKALMVSVTMVNHAEFAQPYPNVQIDFSDIRGDIVASRQFTPDEYLRINTASLDLLQPGNPVTFTLELKDPGKQAMTYEFEFL